MTSPVSIKTCYRVLLTQHCGTGKWTERSVEKGGQSINRPKHTQKHRMEKRLYLQSVEERWFPHSVVLRQLDSHWINNGLNLYLTLYTNINFKCIKDLNIKWNYKSTGRPGGKGTLCNLREGKAFFNYGPRFRSHNMKRLVN